MQGHHQELNSNHTTAYLIMKPLKNTSLLIGALLVGTMLCIAASSPLLVGALAATGIATLHRMVNVNPYQHGSLNVGLVNLAWGDGDDNMGGLRTKAYYCMHTEVQTFSAPTSRAAATTLGQLATQADHTFVSGKGWKEIYTTEDTGMVESTMQGELDGKSWVNKIKVHFPGGKAQIMGFLRWIQNAGTHWLGVDAEGAKRLVGSEHWPAKLVASTITTTETAAGRKGATIEAQASSPFPAPIVSGNITTEDDSSN